MQLKYQQELAGQGDGNSPECVRGAQLGCTAAQRTRGLWLERKQGPGVWVTSRKMNFN